MAHKLAIAGLILSLIAACTQAPVTSATREASKSAQGEILEIDREARRFVVQANRSRLTLRANEGVVNFDQLRPGDIVRVEYAESVAVSLADPDDASDPSAASGTLLAPEGAMPGALSAGTVTAVVEFLSFDSRSNSARIRLPNGSETTVQVAPEMRAFARDRAAGDRVQLVYTIAQAITVEPTGG